MCGSGGSECVEVEGSECVGDVRGGGRDVCVTGMDVSVTGRDVSVCWGGMCV